MSQNLMQLIENAPWREAVTYRDTWPHEYVLLLKDGQRELMAAVRDRMKAGEALVGRFFSTTPTYLFIGDYKKWTFYEADMEDLSLHDDRALDVMVAGEVYLIQVEESTRSVLNGTPRNLTCSQGNCWNQLVW